MPHWCTLRFGGAGVVSGTARPKERTVASPIHRPMLRCDRLQNVSWRASRLGLLPRQLVGASLAVPLEPRDDTRSDVGEGSVGQGVNDLQPVRPVAAEVAELRPNEPPSVGVPVVVADAVLLAPSACCAQPRRCRRAQQRGRSRTQATCRGQRSRTLCCPARRKAPAVVGDLDAVVARVDLHNRPAASAVARLVGADERAVGEDVASQ